MRFWPKTVSNEFMSDGRQYEKVVELSADVALSGAATVELAPIVELAAPSAGTQTAALKAASLLMRKDSFESEGSGRGGVRQRGGSVVNAVEQAHRLVRQADAVERAAAAGVDRLEDGLVRRRVAERRQAVGLEVLVDRRGDRQVG